MKVLISTDIEGVAGVFHHEQVRAGNPEYERARLLMTHEANAAIAGAFDAGATEVLVNDSHGSFRNMTSSSRLKILEQTKAACCNTDWSASFIVYVASRSG